MAKVTLSPPWATYYREIKEMFGQDPEIKIIYNEDNGIIKLYVDNAAKADALSKVLPRVKNFGNVDITINIIPGNARVSGETSEDFFKTLFKGNPVVDEVRTVTLLLQAKFTYVIFRNEVVQFYNDNLSDINGNKSTLYEDIAREILEIPAEHEVSFCTSPNKINAYLSTLLNNKC